MRLCEHALRHFNVQFKFIYYGVNVVTYVYNYLKSKKKKVYWATGGKFSYHEIDLAIRW